LPGGPDRIRPTGTEAPRFLFVRLGSLGDVIHGIPAAAALRNRYPHAHIDWLVDSRYIELLALVECLDRRIAVDPRDVARGGRWATLLYTFRDLRKSHYDACIDLQGLLKSAVLARAAGARMTIGYPRPHLREPLAGLLYTDTPDPGDATHVINKGIALLAPLGVTDTRVHFPLVIPRTPVVESVMGRFSANGYVLINPGAAWPNKRWPATRFGAVAAAIHRDAGLRSLVLWGPGEQELAASVVSGSSGAADIAPPTSIQDVVGISRHARLMISGDTGPLHIAGAVGTPIVALFGPTLAARNGPWLPQDLVISRTARCTCLYERQCRKAVPCIDDISVDEVVSAAQRRLSVHG
jgi:lipopolysaccharide heptosyltransferase I